MAMGMGEGVRWRRLGMVAGHTHAHTSIIEKRKYWDVFQFILFYVPGSRCRSMYALCRTRKRHQLKIGNPNGITKANVPVIATM